MDIMYWRLIADVIGNYIGFPYVQNLFGARQTGKSTLLHKVFPNPALWLDLSNPQERTRYLAHPGEFIAECNNLAKTKAPHIVVVDEAQTVPSIFDAVQSLYDTDKTRWQFVLCGSSARKLRQAGANLLPGRSLYRRLFTLSVMERPFPVEQTGVGEPWPLAVAALFPGLGSSANLFPPCDLDERLAYGELPGIVMAETKVRAPLLQSYAAIYLEEEIRREGLVRDWGAFARFLQLSAAESGRMLNIAAISREAGVSVQAIKSYYQLLEDMFIGFRVNAFSQSSRKHLFSTPRFFFFDAGVRHAAAGLTPGMDLVKADPGPIFEQWVGQELWKRLQYLGRGRLYYYRTKSGAEIDFVVELDGRFIPVEVKWTEHPTVGDAAHIVRFIHDLPGKTERGYVVCRCRHPMQLHAQVTALPVRMI